MVGDSISFLFHIKYLASDNLSFGLEFSFSTTMNSDAKSVLSVTLKKLFQLNSFIYFCTRDFPLYQKQNFCPTLYNLIQKRSFTITTLSNFFRVQKEIKIQAIYPINCPPSFFPSQTINPSFHFKSIL